MYRGALKQTFHKLKKLPAQILGPKLKEKSIVWVGGVPRCGTNMLMGCYDRHPLAHVYHEADPTTFQNYNLKPNETLRRRFFSSRASFIVCKALLDADRLPELTTDFPHSKILWPIRNFSDVLNSHLVRWPAFRENVDEIATGISVDNWRGRNLSEASRDLVKSLYFPECSIADCKALFWLYRSNLYFDLALAGKEDVLTIRYEDFTQNPQEGCKLLADLAGLPQHPGMTKGIHSKSIRKSDPPSLHPAILQACEEMQEKLLSHCHRF
ncbi:MAG: hypothetical protein HWE25_00035 [Alphaproteobacteria bacterium]|nr:hypothetical protein [Alphaproteobacteria bacterium]